MKRCSRCKTFKPLAEFQTRIVNGKEYPHSHCHDCKRAVQRECMRKRAKQTRMDFRMVPFGTESPNAKLTASDVRLIRELLTERDRLREKLRGLSLRAIAEKFEVSNSTIHAIAAEGRYSEVA